MNARVESNGHTALSLACLAAHYPVVKLLLARGAWPFYRVSSLKMIDLEHDF